MINFTWVLVSLRFSLCFLGLCIFSFIFLQPLTVFFRCCSLVFIFELAYTVGRVFFIKFTNWVQCRKDVETTITSVPDLRLTFTPLNFITFVVRLSIHKIFILWINFRTRLSSGQTKESFFWQRPLRNTFVLFLSFFPLFLALLAGIPARLVSFILFVGREGVYTQFAYRFCSYQLRSVFYRYTVLSPGKPLHYVL